jgi:hypothetical protein
MTKPSARLVSSRSDCTANRCQGYDTAHATKSHAGVGYLQSSDNAGGAGCRTKLPPPRTPILTLNRAPFARA